MHVSVGGLALQWHGRVVALGALSGHACLVWCGLWASLSNHSSAWPLRQCVEPLIVAQMRGQCLKCLLTPCPWHPTFRQHTHQPALPVHSVQQSLLLVLGPHKHHSRVSERVELDRRRQRVHREARRRTGDEVEVIPAPSAPVNLGDSQSLAHRVMSRFHPPCLLPSPLRTESIAISSDFIIAGASSSTSCDDCSAVGGYGIDLRLPRG